MTKVTLRKNIGLFVRSVLLTAGIVSSWGCTSNIPDLTLISVKLVYLGRQNEIWGEYLPDPSPEGIEIYLVSHLDLYELAYSNEYNLYATTRYCDDDPGTDRRSPIDTFGVYWDDFEVSAYSDPQKHAKAAAAVRKRGGGFVYHAFILAKRPHDEEPSDRSGGVPVPRPAYNMETRPRDLCFLVRGGNAFGFTVVSNEVRISRQVIADTFKKGMQ